jgi:hypothetical protein
MEKKKLTGLAVRLVGLDMLFSALIFNQIDYLVSNILDAIACIFNLNAFHPALSWLHVIVLLHAIFGLLLL